jgi:hypothetical protein
MWIDGVCYTSCGRAAGDTISAAGSDPPSSPGSAARSRPSGRVVDETRGCIVPAAPAARVCTNTLGNLVGSDARVGSTRARGCEQHHSVEHTSGPPAALLQRAIGYVANARHAGASSLKATRAAFAKGAAVTASAKMARATTTKATTMMGGATVHPTFDAFRVSSARWGSRSPPG